MTRWARNFRHTVVGGAEMLREFTSMGALDDGTAINYGYALYRYNMAGHEAIGHGGTDAGFRALFSYFPAEDFAVVLLANAPLHRAALIAAVADIYLNQDGGAAQGDPRPPASATDGALSGHYLSSVGRMVTIESTSGGMSWRVLGEEPNNVIFRPDGSFELSEPDALLHIYFHAVHGDNGQVMAFEANETCGSGRIERYRRVDMVHPTMTDPSKLTGDYRNTELDVTYSLCAENGSLVARMIWLSDPVIFTPTTADRFESETYQLAILKVQRDSTGEVAGILPAVEYRARA